MIINTSNMMILGVLRCLISDMMPYIHENFKQFKEVLILKTHWIHQINHIAQLEFDQNQFFLDVEAQYDEFVTQKLFLEFKA